ncbi:DUF4272 domain-containing protein [Undibacterium sp. SXout7W]|uniref:DUF4272 domain-containing protein n=1 Tax=Undibacterium sp. SXout7W TaxID=3413049 RepID=UPI003BF17212
MKSPELRKELSELMLHKRGIRINFQLPLIESEDEIHVRSSDEISQRLIALCLMHQFAQPEQRQAVIDLIESAQLQACFSPQEQSYLFSGAKMTDETCMVYQQAQALHFLMWAAGLEDIGMPDGRQQKSVVEQLWRDVSADAMLVQKKIKLRSKTLLLDWADLLYRLHWAVRHAQITGKPTPGRLDAHAVHAWHQAANWMIQYEDEHDWDKVSTETAG